MSKVCVPKVCKFSLGACLFVLIGLLSVSTVRASVVADLVTDYDETGADPNVTPAVFAGSTSGTWTASSDGDADPTNGGLTTILYRDSSPWGTGGDRNAAATGFAGTGAVIGDCCGPFPILSDDGIFDNIVTPPAGTLTVHPGGSTGNNTPPEFLVLQYTATSALTDVALDFSFDQSNTSGKVTYQGQPLKAGSIAFALRDRRQTRVRGRIRPDGSFAIQNAPKGQNVVTIETESLLLGPRDAYVKIPAHYGKAESSTLVAEVTADGENEFTFDLVDN